MSKALPEYAVLHARKGEIRTLAMHYRQEWRRVEKEPATQGRLAKLEDRLETIETDLNLTVITTTAPVWGRPCHSPLRLANARRNAATGSPGRCVGVRLSP